MKIINTEDQFEQEILKAPEPMMVDFYADWCGPCKALAPLLEEMDAEEKSYGIAEVNVDDMPELAQAYQVASVPTILVFRDGVCVGRNVGLANRAELEKLMSAV